MTELIWDGKYDEDGRRIGPLRAALPFQTVETVNESAQQRQRALDLFSAGRDPDWRNRLIWGDKKYVLPSLLADGLAGQVNLIYIDPPFNVGADFSFTALIPSPFEGEGQGEGDDETATFVKEPSIIEQKAYRDTWGRGLDSYLQWFYETVVLLRELLAEDGSIYVHLDWHVGHYAKAVLDEVFGGDCCQNEIVWKRTTARSDSKTYNHIHDTILFYTKAQDSFTYNRGYTGYDPDQVSKQYRREETTGRLFQAITLIVPGVRSGSSGKPWRGIDPSARGDHWKYRIEKLEELDREGRVYWPPEGSVPRLKQHLDEMPGMPLQSMWSDILLSSNANERTGYASQKPEALLERFIQASSNENDLVLDCFCGSGTTAAAAEKLNRRWIACDLGRFAIHVTRKRLLSIENVRPFVVQNLGKYERQAWQAVEFGNGDTTDKRMQAEAQRAYTEFVLKLYGARAVTGYAWLHGLKAGRMAHVGSVDAPVSVGDVAAIVAEFKRAIGAGKDAPSKNGVDVLGWDFAFELNEVARQQAAQANLDVRFLRIPRDVMDRRAVEQGDIHFFELAALSVEILPLRQAQGQNERSVTLTLTDFVIPPDDVPQDVQRAITHWSQWIDYWAVDWDNRGDTFHNEWQTYRTRKDRELQRSVTHTYDAPGEYTIVVKVIDILGNDTTKTVRVKISS